MVLYETTPDAWEKWYFPISNISGLILLFAPFSLVRATVHAIRDIRVTFATLFATFPAFATWRNVANTASLHSSFTADNLPYEQIGNKEPICIADEIPFEIPESWEWCRLGMIIQLQSGQDMAPEKYNSTGHGIPYVTGASNLSNGELIINRWTEYGKAFAYEGDILLTCKGTIGEMVILKVYMSIEN